ncbi:translation initiation factor IF-2-like [Oryx dammah]|uniref:translation initiation factor IF-2-like n=1 Tax=Oryx dammah TaxID=59534 RepID=UPI001A9A7296|nr:translation initiation factor IF-2-like [Oryx dammah]
MAKSELHSILKLGTTTWPQGHGVTLLRGHTKWTPGPSLPAPRGSRPTLASKSGTSRPAPPTPLRLRPRPPPCPAAIFAATFRGTPDGTPVVSGEPGADPGFAPRQNAAVPRHKGTGVAETPKQESRVLGARKTASRLRDAARPSAAPKQAKTPHQPGDPGQSGSSLVLTPWLKPLGGLPLQSLVLLPPLQRPMLPLALLPLMRHGGRGPWGSGRRNCAHLPGGTTSMGGRKKKWRQQAERGSFIDSASVRTHHRPHPSAAVT